MTEREVTESRTDHQRAHLRRDHLVLQRPSFPHMEGIFESMVKQVRRAMKTVINDQVLPEETLHTVLVEAEAIVNSRLLTAVSDDINNYVVLTPNHFLIGRASSKSAPGQFEGGEINSRKRWRMGQAVADMIWQ